MARISHARERAPGSEGIIKFVSLARRPGLPLIIAIAVTIAGCSSSDTTSEQAPAAVGVYTVQPQRYTVTETLPGRTRAYMTSEVRPQIDGIIQKRLFTEGADVKAGEVLYQIDPARYQAAVDQARARLTQARAAVKSAAPKAKRYTNLARIDAISKQDRDNAVAQLAQDKADVATARANLKSAQIDLGYTRIKAPISGRIGASSVTPGALVTANQTDALTTINQLDPIYVDIRQSVGKYLKLKHAVATGQLETNADNAAPVTVTPQGDSDTRLTGKLEFSGVTVDSDTGSVMLRAIVPNAEHALLPGMYVRARLTQGIAVKSILVPQQGVQRSAAGQPTALIVNAKNKAVRKTLTVASATDDHRWRVTSGLGAGDRVIVQGTGKVSVGDKVRPTEVVFNAQGNIRPADRARPAKRSNNGSGPA